MVVFYMVSPRVKRSLVYGPAPRNRLDLYLPPGGKRKAPVPVVIYITGARRGLALGRRHHCDTEVAPAACWESHALQLMSDRGDGTHDTKWADTLAAQRTAAAVWSVPLTGTMPDILAHL